MVFGVENNGRDQVSSISAYYLMLVGVCLPLLTLPLCSERPGLAAQGLGVWVHCRPGPALLPLHTQYAAFPKPQAHVTTPHGHHNWTRTRQLSCCWVGTAAPEGTPAPWDC